MIIYTEKLIPKGYNGMTVYPFIFLRKKFKEHPNHVIINHEKIHIRQQKELLFFVFMLFYFLEMAWHALKFRKRGEVENLLNNAYRSISFEREAYTHQYDMDYLTKRKFLGMWRD
ncbi:MAG: hypothetical protein GY754_37250 [bacterium]|nr:hypothetical protein [bacterium]